jgi:excisionase family DNA binding protein
MIGNLPTLTTLEARAVLKVSRPKLYELIRSGQLEASFIARKWVIRQSAIEKYLDRMSVGNAA